VSTPFIDRVILELRERHREEVVLKAARDRSVWSSYSLVNMPLNGHSAFEESQFDSECSTCGIINGAEIEAAGGIH